MDSRDGLFRIPPTKLARLQDQAAAIRGLASREARLVPARLLAGFIGYAQSVELACPMARFYLRSLHDVLATRANWEARVRLSRQALRDLLWWRHVGSAQVSRAIWRAPNERTLHCDASRLAWGGVLDNTVPASGMWAGRNRGRHINYLELLAVDNSLQAFASELRGQHVLLWEDNTTVMHVLNNRTTRSPELMHLLRTVHHRISALGVDLEVRWIASEDNSQADALSRGSPFDELQLRSARVQELNRQFGVHDVDRYATAANAKAPRFSSLLPEEGSIGASALSHDWHGANNLVFPPPADLPRVAQLLAEQSGIRATVVAPYWPAQHWYQRLLSVAASVDTSALMDVAAPPDWLPGSARTALSGAMLSIFRVEARLGSSTDPSSRK